MKMLFITHTYPPVLGGIENQNYELAKALGKITKIKVIANTKGKPWLPIFIPIAFLRAFFLMTTYDVCLFGSGVLSPLGTILKFFHTKKKFFSIIHGLDVAFAKRAGFLPSIYKKINIPSLAKLDGLFAVGNATIEEAVIAGIEREKCVFIPNGVNPDDFKKNHTRKELSALFGKNLTEKKVILRLGRFVPHKGTLWFIENVMPKLPENVVLICAGGRVKPKTSGDADNFIDCENAIIANCLEDRVRLMPSIPQEDMLVLLNTVDLVVSPNIKKIGTMEGFGINAIEAGACQRVILASNLEGLADAIHNGKNGILAQSENVNQWVEKINKLLSYGDDFAKKFGARAGEYVRENFAWEKIAKRYLKEMEK